MRNETVNIYLTLVNVTHRSGQLKRVDVGRIIARG